MPTVQSDPLAEFEQRSPDGMRLAELACLAVRVEPHFLRALRRQFVAASLPGIELELWHSPLAASRGADAFTFDAAVLQALRERLSREPGALKERVRDLTLRWHAHHSDLARIETKLNALAVVDPGVPPADIETDMGPVLDRLRSGGPPAMEVARWLLHAAPRLHPRVRDVGATWAAVLGASALLGGRRLLAESPPGHIDLASFERVQPLIGVDEQPLGVALANGRLEFRSSLLAGARIDVPVIDPPVVVVRTDDGRSWSVEALPGRSYDVGDALAVTVHTLSGKRFRLRATRQPRAGGGRAAGRAVPLLLRVRARTSEVVSYALSERDAPHEVPNALTEVRAEMARSRLVREIVAIGSNETGSDPSVRRTLHHLLIPREMQYLLDGNSETIIDADAAMAGIPWELLDNVRVGAVTDLRPWSIRAKLLRAAPAAVAPPARGAAQDEHVLVIGEPRYDAAKYPGLPGARSEARAVVEQLVNGPHAMARDRVHALVGEADAGATVTAFFARRYKAIHITGHGAAGPLRGGVVLSDGDVSLGADEVRAMESVPELMFVNCGHLPRIEPSTPAPYDRAEFASTFAQALLAAGVQCVVMAGWAVEDAAAEQFAGTFYEALLRGDRFVDAVAAARHAAWRDHPQGNTWGAYQCYGDPRWRWRSRAGGEADRAERDDTMASPVALVDVLVDLSHRAAASGAERPRIERRLQRLEARHAPLWGGMGAVAQGFAAAYGALDDDDKALSWYRQALASDDGSVTFKAIELLAHHLARSAEKSEPATALMQLEEATRRLIALVNLQNTIERENLLASMFKRKAVAEADAHRHREAMVSLQQAQTRFAAIRRRAGESRPGLAMSAARNSVAVQLRLALATRSSKKTGLAEFQERIAVVERMVAPDNLESRLCRIELRWLAGIAAGSVARVAADVVRRLAEAGAMTPEMRKTALHDARFTLAPWRAGARPEEARAVDRIFAALQPLAPDERT